MDELDNKLDQIIQTVVQDGQFISAREFLIYMTERFDPEHDKNPMSARVNSAVEQVKQAFIDAGYTPPTVIRPPEEFVQFIADKMFKELNYGQPVMTGQEWYDRFEKLLKHDTRKVENECPKCGAPYNWDEAAKKAAGIEQ